MSASERDTLNPYRPLEYHGGGTPEMEELGDSLDEETGTDYLKAVIFGCNDGLCFSMVVVSAAVGSGVEWENIVAVCLSSIVASCILTGAGEFFSSRAHKSFMQAAVRRETWNYKQNRQEQIASLALRYQRKGMSKSDSELLSNKMSTNETFFIGQLVSEDIGLQLPDDSDTTVLIDVLIMVLSYLLCGAVPLFIFVVPSFMDFPLKDLYAIYLAIASVLLIFLGAVKSFYSHSHWTLTSLESLGVAGVAALVSFLASSYITMLFA